MKIRFLLGLLPLALLGLAPAQASTLDLKLLQLNDDQQSKGCPAKVIAYQTPQPYREGGYSTDGMIRLDAIATNIQLTETTPFSVTWSGPLKPQYKACRATAGMSVVDGSPYEGHSYLRMQIINGQASVILDMTGMRDANDYTTVILFKGMRDGNPRWTWGGTD
ncbi:MAG: hypothetical protein ACFCU8_02120 [Thermosynechococcaceae cyanobacterium]